MIWHAKRHIIRIVLYKYAIVYNKQFVFVPKRELFTGDATRRAKRHDTLTDLSKAAPRGNRGVEPGPWLPLSAPEKLKKALFDQVWGVPGPNPKWPDPTRPETDDCHRTILQQFEVILSITLNFASRNFQFVIEVVKSKSLMTTLMTTLMTLKPLILLYFFKMSSMSLNY